MCLGIPGQIIGLEEEAGPLRAGRVRFGGVTRQVNLAFTPEAGIGDWVIVHVGFAISRIDEAEAEKTLAYLDELGELEELALQNEAKEGEDD